MQILIPTTDPTAWRALLGDPEKHWRTGFSAKTLAHCWHDGPGFPAELRAVFEGDFVLKSMEPLIAIPEHKVALPGRGFPTQMDVWVLAKLPDGLVSIGIEGKVAEPFGETIAEWNPDNAGGRSTRANALAKILGLNAVPASIRYQLLHRTAGTVIEAKRFGATRAIMVVHAFDAPTESFDDFAAFVRLFGVELKKNEVVAVGSADGVGLALAWIDGDTRYRTA